VLDGEFEHVSNLLGATDRATPNADGFGDQGEGRDSGEGLFALLQKLRTRLKPATYSPAQLDRKMSLAVDLATCHAPTKTSLPWCLSSGK
jgi:hypothetical protein